MIKNKNLGKDIRNFISENFNGNFNLQLSEYAEGDDDKYQEIEDKFGNPEILKIIDNLDNLGFDLPGEALNAILIDPKWEVNFDFGQEDPSIVNKVKQWRTSIISKGKNKSVKENQEVKPEDKETIKYNAPNGELNIYIPNEEHYYELISKIYKNLGDHKIHSSKKVGKFILLNFKIKSKEFNIFESIINKIKKSSEHNTEISIISKIIDKVKNGFETGTYSKINENDVEKVTPEDKDLKILQASQKTPEKEAAKSLDVLVDKLFDGNINDPIVLKKIKVVLTNSEHPDKKGALELIDKKLKGLNEAKQFKVDKTYTHFALDKASNKIITGWEYKDLDAQSIAYYTKMDLKDMDIKPSEVSILSVKGLKAKGIDPFNWDSWKRQGVDEDTIISTTSGDASTATPDQKKKIQMATAKGDAVKVVKKGTMVTEKTDPIEQDHKDNEEQPVESTPKPKSPNKLSNEIEEHIQSALTILFDSSEGSDDNKYKKLSNDVLKHLNRALEAFNKINLHDTKLSEEAQVKDEKEGEKAVLTVQKHLAKKVKDKNDIPMIMNKYSNLVKKLKDKPTDKVADAIWKHVLKEGKSLDSFENPENNNNKKLKNEQYLARFNKNKIKYEKLANELVKDHREYNSKNSEQEEWDHYIKNIKSPEYSFNDTGVSNISKDLYAKILDYPLAEGNSVEDSIGIAAITLLKMGKQESEINFVKLYEISNKFYN